MSKNPKQEAKDREFILSWIDEMEYDFLDRAFTDPIRRRSELPITDKQRIKALIYNLLRSDKFVDKLNYKRYSTIMDVWIERMGTNSDLTLLIGRDDKN